MALGGIDQPSHIFSIQQILEKKWEYHKDVCQLFIDFEKAYNSIKRKSLYDIVIKFGVPKKLDITRWYHTQSDRSCSGR